VAYVHHPDNMASTRPRTLYQEWDRLRRKHRELARRHGRRFRSGDFLLWYVSRHRLAGRRARGVAAALEGGLRYGRPLTAARCTVRAMRPVPEAGVQTDGEEPRAWLREAQGSWL
jgi:hypothetical protein